MQPLARELRATVLNLVLPGAGFIVRGALAEGGLWGVVVAMAANAAVAVTLLFPDDYPPTARAAIVFALIVAYVGAQARLALALRQARRRAGGAERRAVLSEVQVALDAGDGAAALLALSRLEADAEGDLLIAYRTAQALLVAGRQEAALAAWIALARADRDGIYRKEAEREIAALRRQLAAR